MGLALLLVGLGVGIGLYTLGHLPRNDPRGFAVGFVLGCILPLAMLCFVCTVSSTHRFHEYWEFQELKYGVRNTFALYLVLPLFAASVYGVAHLLWYGV